MASSVASTVCPASAFVFPSPEGNPIERQIDQRPDADKHEDLLVAEFSLSEVHNSSFEEEISEMLYDAQISEVPMEIPEEQTTRKVYMDYRSITARNSKQWRMQQEATTNELGFRLYEGCYMVAMGTYYTGYECGKKFRIVLENGSEFIAITGDVKSDVHTDSKHQHRNGNIIEFIVDTDMIPEDCRKMGDMSFCQSPSLKGKVCYIGRLDSN